VRFVDASHGWVTGGGGIAATRDGGSTWHLQRSSAKGVGPLDFLNDLDGWAVDGGTLIATTNGGATWRAVGGAGALNGATQLRFVDKNRGWALLAGGLCPTPQPCVRPLDAGLLVRTVDGGANWTRLGADWGAVTAMCWTTGGRGWAAAGMALRTTTNGGDTWSEVPTSLDTPSNPPAAGISEIACFSQTAWVFASYGVAAGSEGYEVAHTSDGGARWSTVLGNLISRNVPRVDAYGGPISEPSQQVGFFVGDCPACGGEPSVSITTTTDAGHSFANYAVTRPSDPGLFPVAISFPDTTHGWLLGDVNVGPARGAIYATSDGAHTWRLQYTSAALQPPGP
jgi:photosystem II stability/assembly factor-like uncharacterized protein